jgi:Flp pilus assembly protein TadG
MADRKQSASSASQRGVLTVELAIILPVFGILLLGVLELGGIAHDYQILQNAAREGAQFAARSSNRTTGMTSGEIATIQATIKNRIIAYLAPEKITVSSGDIALDQTHPIAVGGITVNGSEVTITYNRPLIFPGISRWIPLSTTVRGKAIFRNFY